MVSTRCTPFSTCSKREERQGRPNYRITSTACWLRLRPADRRQGPHGDALNVIDRAPYITAHLNDDLADSLATVSVSRAKYFSKRFKNAPGPRHISTYSMQGSSEASSCCGTTALPVGAISADCGFHIAASIFCAAFKRANGKSPSQYRAELSQPFNPENLAKPRFHKF